MKSPIIGITTDIEGEYLKIKCQYSESIVMAGGSPVLIPPAGGTSLYAGIIDGLLIPGGDDLAPGYYNEAPMLKVKPVSKDRSNFEFSLLKNLMKFRKPVLGICYGMQLINVAFGGSLYQDIDFQLKVEINHKKDYHIAVIAENKFLKKGRFSVNSTHHQAIKELGAGLSSFAYSTDNLIEAFNLKDYPFLIGVQWHPERMKDDEISLNLFNLFVQASSHNK